MPFTETCPECRARQEVPDEAAGKRLRCKRCQTVFRAGNADVEAVPDEPPPRPRSRRPDDDRPRGRDHRDDRDDRPRERGPKKRSVLPVLLIVIGVVVLIGVGSAVYTLMPRGRPTDYTDPD